MLPTKKVFQSKKEVTAKNSHFVPEKDNSCACNIATRDYRGEIFPTKNRSEEDLI